MSADDPKKMVFAIAQTSDGVPMIILGIPRAAWLHMKDGKTHEFDFTKAGQPFRMMLFGGRDRKTLVETMQKAATAAGNPLADAMSSDFSFENLKTRMQ